MPGDRSDPPSFREPRTADLPQEMRDAAAFVARRLGRAGHRAWIVGGAVRDLCLGRTVKDVDLVSAATPEVVEGLFDRVISVGRAFGILRIPVCPRDGVPSDPGPRSTALDLQEGVPGGDADDSGLERAPRVEVELATFRTEAGYADARRPDAVQFSSSAEEDALRRDFTCNALYLDPLDDTCLDPEGGLEDLRAGRLRAVGDAEARFREDGLRLVRMARFEAQLGLVPTPGLHQAARSARKSLRGVSSERVLEELGRALAMPAASTALRAIAECELLSELLPTWWRLLPESGPEIEARAAALDRLPEDRGRLLGLAVLLEPAPLEKVPSHDPDLVLQALPLPRVQHRMLADVWDRRRELAFVDDDPAHRSRLLRGEEGELALELLEAWEGADDPRVTDLVSWRAARTPDDLDPAPLLDGRALLALGAPAGPPLGALTRALIDAQLRGEIADVAAARTWVRRRV